MKGLLLLATLFSAPHLWARSVSIVPFTESSHAIPGFSPKGDVTFSVKRFQVDAHYPDGKTERGDVFVIYDPESGHYLWLFGEVGPVPTNLLAELQSRKWAFYADESRMVQFVVQSDLDVQERGGAPPAWTRHVLSPSQKWNIA